MKIPLRDLWTYAIVTIVTVLIWLWAAGETREQRAVSYGRLHFDTTDEYAITPVQGTFTAVLQGSRSAVDRAEAVLLGSTRIEVRTDKGRQTIDLAERLRAMPELAETGVTIKSVDPPTIEVDIDSVESISAPVNAILQGVQRSVNVKVEPAEVKLTLPSRMLPRIPKNISVEAVIDQAVLNRLERGVPQTIESVKVRVPEWLSFAGDVRPLPAEVRVTFTILSRTRDIQVDNVPIQIAGDGSVGDKVNVECQPQSLTGVTITAEADLAGKIESREVPVVAVVHLTGQERKDRIASKSVSYFMAFVSDDAGGVRGVQVQGKVGESTDAPVVRLAYRERE